MIKVEVINEDFTLERFNELKNITRKSVEEKGKLFKGDTFECDEKMVDYLTGNNPLNKVVVKVIEVEPEKVTVEKVIESAKDDKEEVIPLKDLKEIELNQFGNPFGTRELKSKKKKSSKK